MNMLIVNQFEIENKHFIVIFINNIKSSCTLLVDFIGTILKFSLQKWTNSSNFAIGLQHVKFF